MRFSTLASICVGAAAAAEAGKAADAILLSKVKTLTLRSGKETTHRRVSSIPQLRCIGGNAKPHYQVDVMRCKNVGSDYDANDVQWTCEAALPPEFKLGGTEVMCEGYDSPDDPYILKGSCGVEYKLQLTELGEVKYGNGEPMSWADTLIGTAVILFIFGVIGYMIYDTCTGGNRQGGPRGPPYGGGWGGGPGGGWGGGGGDGSDPPPPYTPGPGGPKGPNQSTASGSGSGAQPQQNQPGFWSGTLAGAAAGYIAGRLGGGNNQYYDQGYNRWSFGPRWNNGWNNGYYGGGGGFYQRPYYERAPTPSGSTHQSTGYGGTSRR